MPIATANMKKKLMAQTYVERNQQFNTKSDKNLTETYITDAHKSKRKENYLLHVYFHEKPDMAVKIV